MMMGEMTARQFEIIESAGKILTVSGVGGLTTKKLASEMGFSEAALYRHFKGKEDIIISMLVFLAKNMDERFEALDHDLSSVDRFRAIFQSQIDFFSKHPHFVVVVFADSLMEESDRINDYIVRIMKVMIKYLLPTIKEAQQNGQFTDEITANEMVHIIMGSFRLKMYKWRMSNFEDDLNLVGNQLIESLIKILKIK